VLVLLAAALPEPHKETRRVSAGNAETGPERSLKKLEEQARRIGMDETLPDAGPLAQPGRTATECANTGIAGLDDVLRGGLPRQRIYLLQGSPGSGKTTLALQFLLAGAARGETSVYVTLSETEEELRGVAASHGWSLDGIVLFEFSALETSFAVDTQNTLFHPSEVELGETTQKILEFVEKIQPRRIVFDSLSELRLLAGEALRYRRQILLLKQYFTGKNCTVLFISDATREVDVELQSLAHGVLLMEKLPAQYGATRRHLEVMKLRGVEFRSGQHDYVIAQDGIQVFPRLVAAEHSKPFPRERLSSGVADLDHLLGGGLERGTSTLLVGPAGSGKSSTALQYVHAALMRGDGATVFSFDESIGIFFARARGIGIELQPFVDQGLLGVRQVDPAELSPGEFAHLIRQSTEKDQSRLIVIDSLNGYLMAMPEEKYLIIQLHELLTYLGQQGVTTLLVIAQHGLLGSVHSPVDITYLADTVVLFRFFEAAGQVRKAISVMKKRIGSHEDAIRELRIDASGLRVGQPLAEFRGVLTGVPIFNGADQTLLKEQP
jgi:circadian clock protein KaiC